MQPTALVRVSGTVLNHRRVDIPPRPATETAKAYDGGAYVEVTLSTADCSLMGEEVPGLLAYLTVRFNTDEPTLAELVPGASLDMLLSVFVEVYKVRGRWANSPGFRFDRLAAPVRVRSAA